MPTQTVRLQDALENGDIGKCWPSLHLEMQSDPRDDHLSEVMDQPRILRRVGIELGIAADHDDMGSSNVVGVVHGGARATGDVSG